MQASSKNILVTGGTGFIGSALCAHLVGEGHTIVVKSRHPELLGAGLRGVAGLGELTADEKFDVVVNLAGEPIADRRWSQRRKLALVNSRTTTTSELIDYFAAAKHKPDLFISASAIGYYGIEADDEVIDENGRTDESFSSRLCVSWEACAREAESLGIRTCILRIGIVLGHNGGALQKMLPPFRLGLGGKIGTGNQWMSWIHLEDLVRIVDFCMGDEKLQGPVNCTAPAAVTNSEFSSALGQALRRPVLIPIPASLIKLMMGEMGEELLLAGKKVFPAKLEEAGFDFKYHSVERALLHIVRE